MTIRGPVIPLNNGVEMPAIGLGVFQTPPDATTAAVEEALRLGYRHVDTAAAYGNEREVGEGIRRSGLARDEVFIETKVWISDYGYDETLHAFDKGAGKLGVERLDLLLLHQPLPSAFDRTLGAYRALEALLADGRVRAIGVSNFMPEHLDRLLAEASIVPAVNQIEVHPYFQQTALQRLHAEHGILTQAWSPIGGITSYRGGAKSTFDDPTLQEIADRHGKTPAQVMLRWHLDEGRSAIPKSVRRSASPRTSTSSTSRSPPRRSPPSTRSTPACAAGPTPTASPSKPTAGRSPRPELGCQSAWPVVSGAGDGLTEADIRLFVTLVRFDPAYHGLFRTNLRRLADYPRLSAYLERTLAVPGVRETVNLDHIKRGYYSIKALNPTGIVPTGPELAWAA